MPGSDFRIKSHTLPDCRLFKIGGDEYQITLSWNNNSCKSLRSSPFNPGKIYQRWAGLHKQGINIIFFHYVLSLIDSFLSFFGPNGNCIYCHIIRLQIIFILLFRKEFLYWKNRIGGQRHWKFYQGSLIHNLKNLFNNCPIPFISIPFNFVCWPISVV